MLFKNYYLGCLAQASYLVGDDGRAIVIDPRRDVDVYIADAEAAGARIVGVLETHNHADFVSGHAELAERTGATIYVGAGAHASYPHRAVGDGDVIPLSERYEIRVLETPGHTPEGVTYVLHDRRDDKPLKAFTGDTLFIGDVGRPDLLGDAGLAAEDLAADLFASLHGKLLALPDDVEVWPAHGAGSLCGKALGAERFSTIGAQRASNPALQCETEEAFVAYVTADQPPKPEYFAADVAINRAGAPAVERVLARVREVSPGEASRLIARGALPLDTRDADAFARAHVPGSVSLGLDGNFAMWAGVMLSIDARVLVIAEPGREEETVTRLARIGYENVVAILRGGVEAWRAAGLRLASLERLAADALRGEDAAAELGARVLDVRAPAEWEAGHVNGAEPLVLRDLPEALYLLDPDAEHVVYCQGGYRSMIAASLMRRAGLRVRDVRGGWAEISGEAATCSA